MKKENRAPLMWMQVLLLATTMLLCINIATATPPEVSIESMCKVVDTTLEARRMSSAGRPGSRLPHIHLAVSWVIHQLYRGNFEPVVEVLLAEVRKKLRSEFWSPSLTTSRVASNHKYAHDRYWHAAHSERLRSDRSPSRYLA
jgi:hypothetical protein